MRGWTDNQVILIVLATLWLHCVILYASRLLGKWTEGLLCVWESVDYSRLQLQQITQVSTIAQILQLNATTRTLLSEIHMLVRLYFTVFMSNATSEQSFSALHPLKTYLHCKIHNITENTQLCCFQLAATIDLNTACKAFLQVNDKRRAFVDPWKTQHDWTD